MRGFSGVCWETLCWRRHPHGSAAEIAPRTAATSRIGILLPSNGYPTICTASCGGSTRTRGGASPGPGRPNMPWMPRKILERKAGGFDGEIIVQPKASFEAHLGISGLNQAIKLDDARVSKRFFLRHGIGNLVSMTFGHRHQDGPVPMLSGRIWRWAVAVSFPCGERTARAAVAVRIDGTVGRAASLIA